MATDTIMLVDDEVRVLSSLKREILEEDFCEVVTAQSGTEALEKIRDINNLTTIISDYHMPGLNGIEFFTRVRQIQPDVTRIILTGAGDLEMAVEAVNKGNIFRFLLKPCPSDDLILTAKEGIKQYHLIAGEKELLNKTLNGSIKVMVDILAMLDPNTFAQANRLRNMAREMAKALEIEDQSWELELAAILCRMGAVTVPHDILARSQDGSTLNLQDQAILRSIPKVSKQLIKNIPRLENIADAVGYQDVLYNGKGSPDAPSGDRIPLIARILKIVVDYDHHHRITRSASTAYLAMKQHEEEYDPRMLEIFREKVLHVTGGQTSSLSRTVDQSEVYVTDLKPGMVIAKDVNDRNGMLIVAGGTVISEVLRLRLINYFRSQSIIAPVLVENVIL